jgi:hypothetical protein
MAVEIHCFGSCNQGLADDLAAVDALPTLVRAGGAIVVLFDFL